MKIKIVFRDFDRDNLELFIDEYRNVNHIKFSIDASLQSNGKYTKQYFHLIYRNFILDNETIVAFYKIQENDEIWIGKLDQILQSDDVIVELFSVRFCPTLMYVVMNKNNSILQLKSKLATVISNCAQIWDVKGRQLEDHQQIFDIDLDEEYYKLIIRYDNEIDRSFIESCKIHDRYLDWEYASKNTWLNLCFPYFSKEVLKNKWIRKIMKFQYIMASDRIIAPGLNDNLSRLPSSFVNCHALFCKDIADRIWDICNDNWFLMIGCDENDEDDYELGHIIREFFYTGLTAAIFNYIKCRKSNAKYADKSMRNITIEAMDRFVKLMNDIPKNSSCLIEFAPDFGLGNYSCSGIDELIDTAFNEMYSILKIKMKETMIQLYFPPNEIKNIKEFKEAFSVQTNVPMEQIYLIKHRIGGGDEPKDDDTFEGVWNYHVEIASNMDNVDVDNKTSKSGAFGKVQLCLDKSSLKTIAIKSPEKNEKDLYRDINVLSRLYFSQNIMNYYGLYKNEKGISIAMEYMKKGSLRSYLNEVKYLSEKEVGRISYQILQQLYEMHERGVIHRDIKCDNVVLDDENNVKLIDFGCSKYIQGISADELINPKCYFPGTYVYMAPELIRSEIYSEKIDIWSFGIMLFEMVTGKRPFHECKPYQTILKVKNCKSIEIDPPEPISKELREFINSCLNPNKNERLSALQLLQSKFIANYLDGIDSSETHENVSSQFSSKNFKLFYNLIFGSRPDNLFHIKFFKNNMINTHVIESDIVDPNKSYSECLSDFQNAYFSSDENEKLKAKEHAKNSWKIFNRHFQLEFDQNDTSSEILLDSPGSNDSNSDEKLNTFLLILKDLMKLFKK